jgi:alkylhydroperoxidase family enzyme
MTSTVQSTAPSHWDLPAPRYEKAGIRKIGLSGWLTSRLAGLMDGVGHVEVVEVFARHRRLLWGYAPFAFALVPLGRLPRRDIELVTLRTAWNAGAQYEWAHHVNWSRLGRLSPDDIARVAQGPTGSGWSERQSALLAATDELHAERRLSDGTWARLKEFLDERQLIELCFLVGHYEMLGMMLNSFGVHAEDGIYTRGPLRWLRREDPTARQ